jgi:hypothetical protein
MSFAARLALLMLRLFFDMPAQAQEVEVGTSLICDTQEQVERFVTLFDGDAQRAVNGVNAAEHDPTACAVSTMAYVRGSKLALPEAKTRPFKSSKSWFSASSPSPASNP